MSLRIGIDIGGTFTDLVAISSDGKVTIHKTASTPHDYGEGIVEGLQVLMAARPGPVSDVLHATTVGSNTVLEAKGAKTALITTRGFRDILEIRDLRMPVLYDIGWTKPRTLVERRLRLEVTEKMRPDGSVAVPLDLSSLDPIISLLRSENVTSVAICLLHSYANPSHEQEIANVVKAALPDVAISVSSEILPEIKEYPRTSTTVINAYVQPIVRAYITALDARFHTLGIDAKLQLMQSNGGLASAVFAAEAPAHIIESGPAAGVVGGAALARRLHEPGVITFDMGGTTAKAGLIEGGDVLRTEAIEVGGGVMAGSRLLVGAGYMLKLPAIDLAEVGAGGGSICRLDKAGAPKVGPDSAGASPGPVCYGRGGTSPTITDCNLALGYLDPEGLTGGSMRLDLSAARAAIERDLAHKLNLSIEEAAYGMLRLASATMMRAIRAVSVERGRDPRQFAMLAFGGNGPLFAAGIAAELGIARIIVPPLPGVFSAFGLLVADTEHHARQSMRVRLDAADAARIDNILDTLTEAGKQRLIDDGFTPGQQVFHRAAFARYVGQSSEIEVALPNSPITPAVIAASFADEHEKTYGFRAPSTEPVELISLSVMARGLPKRPRLPERIPPVAQPLPASRKAWFPHGGWIDTKLTDRAGLSRTQQGPLIVQEYDATCLVPRGMSAGLDDFGNIRLEPAATTSDC